MAITPAGAQNVFAAGAQALNNANKKITDTLNGLKGDDAQGTATNGVTGTTMSDVAKCAITCAGTQNESEIIANIINREKDNEAKFRNIV